MAKERVDLAIGLAIRSLSPMKGSGHGGAEVCFVEQHRRSAVPFIQPSKGRLLRVGH